MGASEVNFDGLVGPTHNYAGLSVGNLASTEHAKLLSNPKEAALQGLQKMRALRAMGLKQGVLAPQERPDLDTLRRLGFTGSDPDIIQKAYRESPEILSACYSASSMWTANAATVSPSADTADKRVHFTAANLAAKFHRSLEPQTTARILKAVFRDEKRFTHHEPLPQIQQFGDEGAANHTRFCGKHESPGVELFVYGLHAFDSSKPQPRKFPARQTLEASKAVARLHGLNPEYTVFAQQHPDVIDAGVFHNDVISVGNENVFFFHETAFLNSDAILQELRAKMKKSSGSELELVRVKTSEVSVADAVKSYLFNSQLVTLPSGEMALIAPEECRNTPSVHQYLQALVGRNTLIRQVHYFDVKQSMMNGGGPACLRLRVTLTDEELKAVNPSCLLSDEIYGKLEAWIQKHYRDQLALADLADPKLLVEVRTALDELTRILGLGSVYPFQRGQ